MERTITGTFLDLRGEPAINQPVTISLSNGTFTSEASYLSTAISTRTDNNGQLTVTLFCNEDGEVASRYTASVGYYGDSFEFTLEPGASPTTWSAVRLRALAGAIPPTQTLRHFVEQEVEEQLGSGGVFPTDPSGVVIIDAGLL